MAGLLSEGTGALPPFATVIFGVALAGPIVPLAISVRSATVSFVGSTPNSAFGQGAASLILLERQRRLPAAAKARIRALCEASRKGSNFDQAASCVDDRLTLFNGAQFLEQGDGYSDQPPPFSGNPVLKSLILDGGIGQQFAAPQRCPAPEALHIVCGRQLGNLHRVY